MAAGALQWNSPPAAPACGRRLRPTPEIYFSKPIDNSRLVKVADPQRSREMAMFAVALAVLLMLVMTYAGQHFSAIEYGYRVEGQQTQRDKLLEVNRMLRLEEASLRDPERIDALARRMGLESPQPGQVAPLDAPAPSGGPVLASAQIGGMAAIPSVR